MGWFLPGPLVCWMDLLRIRQTPKEETGSGSGGEVGLLI